MPTAERRKKAEAKAARLMEDSVRPGLRLRGTPRVGLQATYHKFEVYGYERLIPADKAIRDWTQSHFWVTRILRVSLCSHILSLEVFDRGPAIFNRMLTAEHDRPRASAALDVRDMDPLIHQIFLQSKGMSRETYQAVMWYALTRFKQIPDKLLSWMPELREDAVEMTAREKALEKVPLPKVAKS